MHGEAEPGDLHMTQDTLHPAQGACHWPRSWLAGAGYLGLRAGGWQAGAGAGLW